MTAPPHPVPHSNVCSLTSAPVLKPTEVAQLLRSVAMLPVGCPSALDRDTAYAVLSQLEELQGRRRGQGSLYVACPYCGERFDTAHGLRPAVAPRDRPLRHPDPIGAAGTLGGAEQAARTLAKAMTWGNDSLRGPEAFWVDFGRTVLWPLLYLARATGWDMDAVRLFVHPVRLADTLVTVSQALADLDPTIDVERARRQWDRILATDTLSLQTAFRYAYGLVNHWQLTGPWAMADGPSPTGSSEEELQADGEGGRG